MPSESVKVMLRCRPMNGNEQQRQCGTCINVDMSSNSVTLLKPGEPDASKVFTFDHVFPPDISQQTIYEESAFPLVEAVVEGYNGTIFAYGQTGCGKTFTMLGDPTKEQLRGIIPRTFEQIVKIVDSSNDKNFLVRCSYLEIYNEEIHDLLGKDVKQRLDVKESSDRGVFIKDLGMFIVKSVQDMEQYMYLGNKNRSTAETLMNKDSSRSHSIFTLHVECSKVDEKNEEKYTAGKLNLVDLAGSERQSKTGAAGQQLKEANKINWSLSALGNVISALVDGKSTHIPYRDSKLTRLLQDSLGGNTKTIMIAAVSPADYNYEESLSTLRYASRAKNIKNQPKVNEDPKDTLLREYAEEIKKLKEMLERQAAGLPVNQAHIQQQMQQVANEQNGLSKSQNNQELKKLQEQNSQMNRLKEKMEEEMRQKDQLFIQEKLERERMEQTLKEMQAKMMVGGKGNEEEQKKYKILRQKVKIQEDEHEKLLEQKAQKEEEVLLMEKKYNNLQEEVEEMRKIIKQLRRKYKQAISEVSDIEREHEQQKTDLLETIRLQEKDIKFYQGISNNLLREEEIQLIRNASQWQDERHEYIIPPFTLKDHALRFPKLNGAQAQALIESEKESRELEIIKQEPESANSLSGSNNGNHTRGRSPMKSYNGQQQQQEENFRYNIEDQVQKGRKQGGASKTVAARVEKKTIPKQLQPMEEEYQERLQEKLERHSSDQQLANLVFIDRNKLQKQNQLRPINRQESHGSHHLNSSGQDSVEYSGGAEDLSNRERQQKSTNNKKNASKQLEPIR